MTISEYINRLTIRNNTLFRIDAEGKGFYVEGDKTYTRKEFDEKYPLPFSFIAHTNSIEGQSGWLVVK